MVRDGLSMRCSTLCYICLRLRRATYETVQLGPEGSLHYLYGPVGKLPTYRDRADYYSPHTHFPLLFLKRHLSATLFLTRAPPCNIFPHRSASLQYSYKSESKTYRNALDTWILSHPAALADNSDPSSSRVGGPAARL